MYTCIRIKEIRYFTNFNWERQIKADCCILWHCNIKVLLFLPILTGFAFMMVTTAQATDITLDILRCMRVQYLKPATS